MPNSPRDTPALLEIRDLHTWFKAGRADVRAVNGVDLTVGAGEILGLVGESGCGKSALALSILRLIDAPGKVVAGSVLFDGKDVMGMSGRELMSMRRRDIGIIFQQPQSCLNPVRRIGWQVADPFVQSGMSRKAAWTAAVALLRDVEIPAAGERARAYPHQISGGQAQRVMIAIALARRPRLLIADEPTTALDVTIQAQILDLLRRRCRESGTSLILVTHDLGVVARYADRVAVMYAGRIVEQARASSVLGNPQHPYTQGLLRAAPTLDPAPARLKEIPGTLPDLTRPMHGCAFAPRCATREALRIGNCETQPPGIMLDGEHRVQCWAIHDARAGCSPHVAGEARAS